MQYITKPECAKFNPNDCFFSRQPLHLCDSLTKGHGLVIENQLRPKYA